MAAVLATDIHSRRFPYNFALNTFDRGDGLWAGDAP
jgi:hypothetical protein